MGRPKIQTLAVEVSSEGSSAPGSSRLVGQLPGSLPSPQQTSTGVAAPIRYAPVNRDAVPRAMRGPGRIECLAALVGVLLRSALYQFCAIDVHQSDGGVSSSVLNEVLVSPP
ncbi:hypothetical protein GCM10010166_61650 [Couchioplanes caeruleus subsp. azureus]|nr:hypothetical protein GCM10010166_61650 [Couchioplanes caeruleus subsp. azureus]